MASPIQEDFLIRGLDPTQSISSSSSAVVNGSQQVDDSAELKTASVTIAGEPALVVSAQLADDPLCQVLAEG